MIWFLFFCVYDEPSADHTYSFSKSALKTLGADLAAAKHKNSGNYRKIVSWYMGEGIYIEGGLG